ncbi:MAG: response regulator transcription factor [Alphaproteobacteria bacterium]|nr:response regulator transcription factor [Alphaproteobacteria bacterium]
MNGIVSIGIFDDHPLMVRGLSQLFATTTGYDVVAVGASVQDALDTVAKVSCDVVILDLRMPGDVIAAIPWLADRAKIIVFSASDDAEMSIKCLDAGAQGFVVKECAVEEILIATSQISAGDIYISSRLAARMMAKMRSRAATRADMHLHLSLREEQVANLVVAAKSNKEIAKVLEISEKTVKHYMTTLMTKLNARNRVEVAMKFKAVSDD